MLELVQAVIMKLADNNLGNYWAIKCNMVYFRQNRK